MTVLIALLASAPAHVSAQAAAQQESALPSAQELVDRYVEAVGGRDAVLASANSRIEGMFSMPAIGIGGEIEVVTAPNRMKVTVTLPGMGIAGRGFDGSAGWIVDPMVGARLLSGQELDGMREQTHPLALVRDPSLFQSMETTERDEVGGQPCYRVELVWNSGRESSDCYDAETGLLVATTSTEVTAMGPAEVTTRVDDYQEFGDVRLPTRLTQFAMGQTQVMRFTSIRIGEVDPAAFEPPEVVQALLER